MVDAASSDPSLFPAQHVPGSDKDGRGMADAASHDDTQRREQDIPLREAHSSKKVAPPIDTGAPRTDSRYHVENGDIMDTIIIDDHGAEDNARTSDSKPGILPNGKIAREFGRRLKAKTH